MTLTIDLTSAEEAHLAAAARLNGLEPAALAKRLVTEHLPALDHKPIIDHKSGASPDVPEQERIARIRAATDSMADDWDSVEELHRDRQIDKAKEEAWAKEFIPTLLYPPSKQKRQK